MLVWLIDDDPGNHAVAHATVARLPGAAFAGHFSGRAACAALHDAAHHPDVVLMDFYLAGERGDQVTRRWREAEMLAGARRAIVIGYSSMRSGSEAIVAAGGDAVVPKRSDGTGINPHLLRWLEAHAR